MGVSSSLQTLKEALREIEIVDIESPEINESGVFVIYDGGPKTALSIMERRFGILCAGFSLSVSSDLIALVESIEHKLYMASVEGNDIDHIKTYPVVVTENGLFIYRIDAKVIDTEI